MELCRRNAIVFVVGSLPAPIVLPFWHVRVGFYRPIDTPPPQNPAGGLTQ
jgi:hypothetical protein